MTWKVGEAKQRLSEVLRRSAREPQRIYSRDRFVAAVVSADLFEDFESWLAARQRRTLGQRFAGIREICAEQGYALDPGGRRDRAGGPADG